MSQPCWRCGGRWFLIDDGDLRCGYCARPQFVRDVPHSKRDPQPVPQESSRKQLAPYQCQMCGAVKLEKPSEAKRRQFCSRTCRTKHQHRRRKQAKPWRELVTG
jgi:hypothetical protein